MTALAARGVRKSFGRRQVTTDFDLEVAAGELVAVVGENGTGKTTLLRILAGGLRLAWTAAFALLGLAVMRLRMHRPSRVTAPAPDRHAPTTDTHHQTLMAAVAQASGGPGRNPGESGLPADQRVVPPPAARAG